MSDLSVWYLLVDSQGNNYQDSTADKIELPRSANISKFRKAVKAENSAKLVSFDANDLKVYLDKNSLYNIPLEPDYLLENVSTAAKNPLKNSKLLETIINGNDEENPLLVVVPDGKEVLIKKKKSFNIVMTP